MNKGDVYYANLGNTTGSEQSGERPVLVFQNSNSIRYSRTVVIIPFTTNLRRSQIPGHVLVRSGEGGLTQDSVALCFQVRVIDKSRLKNQIGSLPFGTISMIEDALKIIFDIT